MKVPPQKGGTGTRGQAGRGQRAWPPWATWPACILHSGTTWQQGRGPQAPGCLLGLWAGASGWARGEAPASREALVGS